MMQQRTIVGTFFLAAVSLLSHTANGMQTGERTVLNADFDGADALAAWQGDGGTLVADGQHGKCLAIEQTATNGSTMRKIDLPLQGLAGSMVTIRASVKADRVSRPPNSWNGVKLMLVIQTDQGF
ncbi:MAG TPA: hypothetical protein VE890_03130, partial [Thermoguttaceae bacterium]|nr:hypothetical protein [Thermoguttaceae bacterium]